MKEKEEVSITELQQAPDTKPSEIRFSICFSDDWISSNVNNRK